MSIVSKDAVAELQRMLRYVFEEVRVEEHPNGDIFAEPRIIRPAWLVVPVAAYVPGAQKSRYELRNEVLVPIYLGGVANLETLHDVLEAKAKKLRSDQELGVNATLALGWDNGVVVSHELEIYDGAPKLTRVNKKTLEKFNVLKTGNSYHFYAKGRAKLQDVVTQVDDDWLSFKHRGAGYIRVSQNVKGPITKWTPEAE